MPHYILRKYKLDHQYVYVGVLLDGSFYCMPYYIMHSCKGDHHYVCVDVLSEYSFY